MKILHNIGYAVLLSIPLAITLQSCFLFRSQKHTTQSSTDSTAYSKIESSTDRQMEEAWNKYLNKQDNSNSGVSFYDTPCPDTGNKVILHVDGSIEATGNIKDVWHNTKKETTNKDSGSKKVIETTKYINTTYTIKETVTKNVIKEVSKKPDYWGHAKIGAVLLLIAYVVWKWASIKAKVITILKGFFTGI